jgi:hypothetical protein
MRTLARIAGYAVGWTLACAVIAALMVGWSYLMDPGGPCECLCGGRPGSPRSAIPIEIIQFVAVLGATFAVALYWALGAPAGRQRTRRVMVAIGISLAAAYPALALASLASGPACT